MKLITILLIGLLISLFCCCDTNNKYDHTNERYTLEGTVYVDCAKSIPYKNNKLELVHTYKIDSDDPGQTETIYLPTNEYGKFSYEYVGHKSDSWKLRIADTGKIEVSLPPYVNRNLGAVNLGEKNLHVILKVKTNKPFGTSDKLKIDMLGNFYKELKGPFTNGQIIDTIDVHSGFFWGETSTNTSVLSFYYSMNANYHTINYPYNLCSKNNVLEIDISE